MSVRRLEAVLGIIDLARSTVAALARPMETVARELQVGDVPWMSGDYLGSLQRPADLSAVLHATRLIRDPITTNPWRVKSGTTALDAPRWISDPMLLRPDARYPGDWAPAPYRKSAVDVFGEWVQDALWNGAGFLLFLQGVDGQPVAGTLRVIPSLFVQTVGSGDGASWRVSTVAGELDFDRSGRWVEDARFRLVLLRGEPPFDPLTGRGLGVIQRAAADLELLARIQRYSSGVYRSGVPSGYLKVSAPSFTRDDAEELRARWHAARDSDGRTTAVLNATTDYQPISISPEDMAVIEAKRLSLLDVALAFGVPAYMLQAASNSMTYSNVETEAQSFVTFTLSAWASRVEAALSALLPVGQWLDIDFRGMMRGDSGARVAYYQGMLAAGAMSPQMVAEAEGYDWQRVSDDLAAVAPRLPETDDQSDDAEEGDDDEPAQ